MNRHCYRVIFNKAAGVMTAVSELAKSCTKDKSAGTSRGTSILSTVWPRFPMKVIAISLALQISGIHVVYAEIVADPNAGAHRPDVVQAPNNVEQVQIVRPDASGLSHNQYQTFNVGQQGAILNNSTGATNTVQAGVIGGNPNLQGSGPARVILNEVTSTNPSRLNGYLEVAGQKADVVISNPNGIHVNGFGFLNTNRGTITTGKPVVTSNGLERVQVTKGQIDIEGRGFYDKGTSQVDIIARSVKANAQIHARNLNVLGGAADVDYRNLGATVIRGEGGKPTVAIDVAELGGMYADRIMLVGNEHGVGVRSAGTIESGSDFILSANGKIELKGHKDDSSVTRLAAKNRIDIASREEDIKFDNIDVSAESVHVDAKGAVHNVSGSITAGKELNVRGNDVLNDDNGLLNSYANTHVDGNKVQNRGRIYGDDITVTAVNLVNGKDERDDQARKAVIAARHDLNVGATHILNQEGATLQSEHNMRLAGSADGSQAAESITNASARISSGVDLAINTKKLDNLNKHYKTGEKVLSSEYSQKFTLHGSITTKWESNYNNNGDYVTSATGGESVEGEVYYDNGDKPAHEVKDGSSSYLQIDGREYTITETSWNKVRNGQDCDNCSGYDMVKNEKVTTSPNTQVTNYDYERLTSAKKETTIEDSAPAIIQAGGDMTLTGDVLNDKSHIRAGGAIHSDGAHINNEDAKKYTYTDVTGIKGHHKLKNRKYIWLSGMDDDFQDHAYESLGENKTEESFNLYKVEQHGEGIGASVQFSDESPDLSQLYQINSDKSQPYLIKTDPAYTKKTDALTSAYQLNQLGLHGAIHIGDGYYEQKQIADQYLKMTGRKLDLNLSQEQAYKLLMDVGLNQGKALNLQPGQALTPEQMKLVQHDMVWMVQKEVKLPDGSKSQAYVPQLYLANGQNPNMFANQAGIVANNIDLQGGTIRNNANLAAMNELQIHSGNVRNESGIIFAGTNADISADGDILNRSGEILAQNINLSADGNLTIDTKIYESTGISGTQKQLAKKGTVAGDHVSIHAGHDIALNAADIASGNNISVSAGNDIKLGTVETQREENLESPKTNDLLFGLHNEEGDYQRSKDLTSNGTTIKANGNVSMDASHDVTASSANIEAGNSITARAGNDVNIADAHDTSTFDSRAEDVDDDLFMTTTEVETHKDKAVLSHGSNLKANNIAVISSHDINVTGSSMEADNNLTLQAANNVNVSAGESTLDKHTEKNTHYDGFGFAGDDLILGTKDDKQTDTSHQIVRTQNKSQLVSKNTLTVKAGEDVNMNGAQVDGATKATVSGKNVNMYGVTDTYERHVTSETSSTGIGIRMENIVQDLGDRLDKIDAANSAGDKELANAHTAAMGSKLLSFGMALSGVKGKNYLKEEQTPAVASMHIGVGSHESTTDTVSSGTHQEGDVIRSGGTVTVAADGKDSGKGNIHGVGTHIEGTDVSLHADNDVTFESAKDTNQTRTTTSSQDFSVGIGLNMGGAQNGLTFEGSAGGSDGDTKTTSLKNTNAQVIATGKLSVDSGNDTTLRGANFKGDSVQVKTGGNLNVESVQDQETYSSKQDSWGVSGSACVAPYCTGEAFVGSIGNPGQEVTSDSRYVTEQSGIAAGKGGYDIDVAKNTDLKGALVTSDAPKDKNTLKTGTLTISDVVNTSTYKVEKTGVNLGLTSGASGFVTMVTNVLNNLDRGTTKTPHTSITKTAMSDANVVIRDKDAQLAKTGKTADETVASINHDTKNANEKLDRYNPQRELELDAAKNETLQNVAPIIYQTLGNKLDEYGANEAVKVLAHGVVGGVLSQAMGGKFGRGAAAAAATKLAVEEFAGKLSDISGYKKGSDEWKALVRLFGVAVNEAVSHASGGSASEAYQNATISDNATHYNYLNHAENEEYREAIDGCLAHDAQSCQRVTELRDLHNRREAKVKACEGVDSEECTRVVAEAAAYVKDAIAAGDGSWTFKYHLSKGTASSYFEDKNQLVRQMLDESQSNLREYFPNSDIAKGFAMPWIDKADSTMTIVNPAYLMLKEIHAAKGDPKKIVDHLSKNIQEGIDKIGQFTDDVVAAYTSFKEDGISGTYDKLHAALKDSYQKELNEKADIYGSLDATKWGYSVGDDAFDAVLTVAPIPGGAALKAGGAAGKVGGGAIKATESAVEKAGVKTGESNVVKGSGKVGSAASESNTISGGKAVEGNPQKLDVPDGKSKASTNPPSTVQEGSSVGPTATSGAGTQISNMGELKEYISSNYPLHTDGINYTVKSEAELLSLYNKSAALGKTIEVPKDLTYMFESITSLPDGTQLWLRKSSKVGGKTIDVKPPGNTKADFKIHIGK